MESESDGVIGFGIVKMVCKSVSGRNVIAEVDVRIDGTLQNLGKWGRLLILKSFLSSFTTYCVTAALLIFCFSLGAVGFLPLPVAQFSL